MPQSLSIVLPTYEEAENIAPLLHELRRHLPEAELIVVDDDSQDGTAARVRALQERDPGLRLIVREDERGLVSALARGIAQARGEVVAWMDCDFSMPPELVPVLCAELQAGADLAIGSRYAPGGSDQRPGWSRRFSSWLINRLARLLLDPAVTDYTTGFVVARREVLDQVGLDTRSGYGEYCIDFLYRTLRRGYTIREVPYACRDRIRGASKTAPDLATFVRRGWGYLRMLAQLRGRA